MSFVPNSFNPPGIHRLTRFTLEVLSPKFSSQDFAAVTQNADSIRYVFGLNNGWPSPTMSFEENLADLQRHQTEFVDGKAFAYAILSNDMKHYWGCLYIKPIKSRIEGDLRKVLYDAQVFFWLTAEAMVGDLAKSVLDEVQAWLQKDWPFKAVAFPGRTVEWQEWEQMASNI